MKNKETLEERKAQAWIDFAKTNEDVNMYSFVTGFDKGAEWQAERMYSEEEIIDLIQFLSMYEEFNQEGSVSKETAKYFLEKFKNK